VPFWIYLPLSSKKGETHDSIQVRTPVDDFNELILENRLLLALPSTPGFHLQRKLQWLEHIVGDRGAYSEDYVAGAKLQRSQCFRRPTIFHCEKNQRVFFRQQPNFCIKNLRVFFALAATHSDRRQIFRRSRPAFDLSQCGVITPPANTGSKSASWPFPGLHLNLG